MQNCERHTNFLKGKFCKHPSCCCFLCAQCVAEHDPTHCISEYADVVDEIRRAKDRQVASRITGISSRKTLLQELEKMLQKVAERQAKLQEEAKIVEMELPKTLQAMTKRIIFQRQEISDKIHDVAISIHNSRESLISDLEDLTSQTELVSNKVSEDYIKEFFSKIENETIGDEIGQFKAKLKEMTEMTNAFESFNPYDYFKELSSLYANYANLESGENSFDKHMKLWGDTTLLSESYRSKPDSFIGIDSILSPGKNEACKKLEGILKKYSTVSTADRSLDGLVQSIDSLCGKLTENTPSVRKPPVKRDRGRTVLIGRKSEVAKKEVEKQIPEASPAKVSRLKPPRGWNEPSKEEAKLPPRPTMRRIDSKKETLTNTSRKIEKKSVERPSRSLVSSQSRAKSASRLAPGNVGTKLMARKATPKKDNPAKKMAVVCKEVKSAIGLLNEALKSTFKEVSGNFVNNKQIEQLQHAIKTVPLTLKQQQTKLQQTMPNFGEQSIVSQSFLLGDDLRLDKSVIEAEQAKCAELLHKFIEKMIGSINQHYSKQEKAFGKFVKFNKTIVGLAEKFVGLGADIRKLKVIWNNKEDEMRSFLKILKERNKEIESERSKCAEYEAKSKDLAEKIVKLQKENEELMKAKSDLIEVTIENDQLKKAHDEQEAQNEMRKLKHASLSEKARKAYAAVKELKTQCERVKVYLLQSIGVCAQHSNKKLEILLSNIDTHEQSISKLY
eukprot:TRINITY_DN105543_c1_g1_i1.p1 TRINITY_DN105543_c1_g1~~TRINITY_DN105543_c1_g1_i1.p1  ORF type:complete len:729 (+),score=89.05 TRINITY_DN105543_c1_g1_i1:2020-4206(+)